MLKDSIKELLLISHQELHCLPAVTFFFPPAFIRLVVSEARPSVGASGGGVFLALAGSRWLLMKNSVQSSDSGDGRKEEEEVVVR